MRYLAVVAAAIGIAGCGGGSGSIGDDAGGAPAQHVACAECRPNAENCIQSCGATQAQVVLCAEVPDASSVLSFGGSQPSPTDCSPACIRQCANAEMACEGSCG